MGRRWFYFCNYRHHWLCYTINARPRLFYTGLFLFCEGIAEIFKDAFIESPYRPSDYGLETRQRHVDENQNYRNYNSPN